ncbi:uncharacterized protein DUF4873 [Tamaricihabitans halophyticus]|uniref:Uncharacterized protein DUF4873 n=1 Tax=Tamaricihabitans halophyticus TaxID=1262583 RepID=A0A4R2QIT3_9PSEU|nr:DUF4873 domain-containing protein [Tamaricihabitans halophyticus]TCP49273.1 uncharacterized protein DUF4873 [Tamaricihabitans halophyticus]
MSDEQEHEEEGFAGEATLLLADSEIPVRVELRGYFQPIDGRYHWYGRITQNERVSELAEAGSKVGRLRTPQGEAEAKLSDPDPWGRYRVAGISTPPFAVDLITEP